MKKHWIGLALTLVFLVGVGLTIPIILWATATAVMGKVAYGLSVLSAILLILIFVIVDSYAIQVDEDGLAGGLLNRPLRKWEDIDEIVVDVGIRFVSPTGSVLIFPSIFRDKTAFFGLLKRKLPWLENTPLSGSGQKRTFRRSE